MKAIKSDLEAELPIVPTRTVSDFVQEFMGVKKPDKVKVKNPTGVRPKGREKQKRIKSGREISMKKSMKKIVVPGGSDHVVGGLRDGASGSVSTFIVITLRYLLSTMQREKQKHIKSGREISMKKSVKKRNKILNGYGVCGSTAYNWRTCPRKNDVDVLCPAVVIPCGNDRVDGGLRDGASGSVSV
ncbi:hypothetical protein Tco_1323999 [Tanacetum coccineum]